jgi:hypothetical protein
VAAKLAHFFETAKTIGRFLLETKQNNRFSLAKSEIIAIFAAKRELTKI